MWLWTTLLSKKWLISDFNTNKNLASLYFSKPTLFDTDILVI